MVPQLQSVMRIPYTLWIKTTPARLVRLAMYAASRA